MANVKEVRRIEHVRIKQTTHARVVSSWSSTADSRSYEGNKSSFSYHNNMVLHWGDRVEGDRTRCQGSLEGGKEGHW